MEVLKAKIAIIGDGPVVNREDTFVGCTDLNEPVVVNNRVRMSPNARDMICGRKYTYFSDFNSEHRWLQPSELRKELDGTFTVSPLEFNLPEHSDDHDIMLLEYNGELFMAYEMHNKIDQIFSQSDKIYDSNARNPKWNSWFGYYEPVRAQGDRPKTFQYGCSAQLNDGPLYFATYDGDRPIINDPHFQWQALDFNLPEYSVNCAASESFLCTGNNGCIYYVGSIAYKSDRLSRRDPRCPSAMYLGHAMRHINNINGVVYGIKSSNGQKTLTAYEYDETADTLIEIHKQHGTFYAHYGICAPPAVGNITK